MRRFGELLLAINAKVTSPAADNDELAGEASTSELRALTICFRVDASPLQISGLVSYHARLAHGLITGGTPVPRTSAWPIPISAHPERGTAVSCRSRRTVSDANAYRSWGLRRLTIVQYVWQPPLDNTVSTDQRSRIVPCASRAWTHHGRDARATIRGVAFWHCRGRRDARAPFYTLVPPEYSRRHGVHTTVCDNTILPTPYCLPSTPYFGCVTPGHASVRKGDAGRPAWLKKFTTGLFAQPKRTAAGFATIGLFTITMLPSISASAL